MSSRLFRIVFLTVAFAATAPVWAQQSDAAGGRPEGIVDAFKQGTARLGFRYRYEYVDQNGIDERAHASTLRTALSYRTAPLRGFEFLIEAENVVEIGDDWYRDAGRPPRGNGVTGRPIVADPAGTDVNQVMLRYRGLDSDLRFGRQEILIGDERFVGAVGWRQHHQTFSAINASNSSLGRVTLQYVFSNRVYRIFGDSLDTANNLLHASIDAGRAGTVRIYGYFLDYSDQAYASSSTHSFGVELSGSQDLGEGGRVLYEVEYARQHDAADNPGNIRASYAHVMGGVGLDAWLTARLGWELLGGSHADGQFRTPLATLHKFNGWADKFLVTPVDGLQDLYVSVSGSRGAFSWVGAYHEFSAATGTVRYGTELDGQLGFRSSWQQGFFVRGAYYGAQEFATNTLKIWLYTTYTF